MEMRLITNELVPVYETDTGEKVVDGRELHQFLEVGRDFTNWIKDRIEKYGFIENDDFSPVLAKTSEGGRPRTEYVLKLDMAKELAMVENNEKGSQARKYFIEVDKRFKAQNIDVALLTPEMQMFKQLWDGLAVKQIEDKRRDEKINLLETGMTTIQETFLQRDEDWRKSTNSMLTGAAYRMDVKHPDLRNESYRILEERAHCDLNKRLRNLKDRLIESGSTKTKVESTTRMDVIEADARLKEIYSSIVKEISIGSLKIAR
jgi:anti-repressor protein